MPSGPQRRETRAPHLSAAAVPVERALLARASALEGRADSERPHPDNDAEYAHGYAAAMAEIDGRMAAEFRTLADELHWWV